MMNFSFLKSRRFGIDLGNNNTLLADTQSVLLDQPSYVAFQGSQRSVKAVGAEAFRMFEKTHLDVKPVKPLRDGVIADYDSAVAMVDAMVKRCAVKKSFYEGFDLIISGVPYTTSNVERRALMSLLDNFHARRSFLLFEPLAAAIGMGLNIREPKGKMVVDIGGGITEIVVISLSGIASFESLKVSGDSIDHEIQDYFSRKYKMAIGLKTSEQVKIQVGAVSDKVDDVPEPMTVVGKDLISGIPVQRKIGHVEVSEILQNSIRSIETAILQTLEKCPPELAADIYDEGIYVTGGNAQLRGLAKRLSQLTKVPVHIDEAPLHAVTKGVSEVLRDPARYAHILLA